MNFTLQRTRCDEKGIFGTFAADDDSLNLVSLEHAFSSEGGFKPAIPAGRYQCVRRLSPEFGYDLFLVTNVPGHDFIEIHVGDFNTNSKGCVLLGMLLGDDCIASSREAFNKFMAKQEGLNAFELLVLDPSPA